MKEYKTLLGTCLELSKSIGNEAAYYQGRIFLTSLRLLDFSVSFAPLNHDWLKAVTNPMNLDSSI